MVRDTRLGGYRFVRERPAQPLRPGPGGDKGFQTLAQLIESIGAGVYVVLGAPDQMAKTKHQRRQQ